jgi:hypothetical protein
MPIMLSRIRIALCAALLLLSAAPLRAAEGIATEAPFGAELTASREHAAQVFALGAVGTTGLTLSRQSFVSSRQSILQQHRLSEHPVSKLASAIAAAGTVDIVQRGTAIARQAVLDCLKGEYPGGGMGSLSMPLLRPTALTDHCHQ